MAKITRRMAINNANNILRNYRKKITDAEQYKEYLPLAGQKIVERYIENRDNYKNLLDSAADSKEFFIGMDDETLVSYANICDRLNNIFDLNVSESRKINGFIDEQFVVRSAEEVITGIRTVEIGRKVEYKLGTPDLYDAKETLAGLIGRYYVEWEVEDIDNNFSAEHNRAEAIVENIADFLDYNFSNPYDRTFNAVKEGHYIIKAKVHDILAGENIVDTIEFEQVVETGDETIMSMDLQQKILRALQLIDWKVDLDFAALTEALFKATGVIIAIAAIATIAPELAAAIVAIMTIGMGIDAAINIIKGIVQLAEALELIQKARSERALQVGGEKIKEGILNIGVGIIEVLLQKMTMKNLAQARVQVLKNVTPTVQSLPQTGLPGTADTLGIAAQSTTKLPALTASTNEVSIILNKSAVQAMENVAEMSILQSEKVALQEMVSTNKLPDYVKLCEQLEKEIINVEYDVLDVVDSNVANSEWKDMGYDLPPIANNTKAFKVKAGNHMYARVFKEGSKSKAKSPFILRYDDIKGLTAKQIADKYALPQIPDRIVFIKLPPDVPLEVSIVGPQEKWKTIGGSVQYTIKYNLLEDKWFENIQELK